MKKSYKRSLILRFLAVMIFLLQGTIIFASEKNSSYTKLDGSWELFINKTPDQVHSLLKEGKKEDCISNVPDFWNKDIFKVTGTDNPITYCSYRTFVLNLNPTEKYAILIKDSPATSCAILVNNEIISQNGKPFPDNNKGYLKSQIKPMYGEFYPDENGNAEIIVFINNYFYRKSGLWDSVFIGKARQIFTLNTIILSFYTIISGILLFIGLLNVIQFIINKNRKEHFYLGIAAVVFALRVSTAGYCSLAILVPVLSAQIKIKLEYMTLWVVPICMLQMITTLYPVGNFRIIFKNFKEKYLRYSILIITGITGILSLVLPAVLSNQLVPVLQIFLGIISVYLMIIIIVKIVQGKEHILFYLFSCGFLIIGGIIDTIYTKIRDFIPLSIFPFFLVIFILIQIILLATIQNDLYKDSRKISKNLQVLNEAYLRFVPKEFLSLLNKESITNIKLGDHSSIEMCIMFSKLNVEFENNNSSYDTSSEHYTIFKEYLENISPIIKYHKGFVSKFLSGGFMALFPESEMGTIIAALKIVEYSKFQNDKYKKKGIKISPRIGIHYGKMVLGTIGEENRLDDTVISDTVNTVSRIESVCEKLNKQIIISQNLYDKVSVEGNPLFSLQQLESMAVKGKQKPLQLYECVIENL